MTMAEFILRSTDYRGTRYVADVAEWAFRDGRSVESHGVAIYSESVSDAKHFSTPGETVRYASHARAVGVREAINWETEIDETVE